MSFSSSALSASTSSASTFNTTPSTFATGSASASASASASSSAAGGTGIQIDTEALVGDMFNLVMNQGRSASSSSAASSSSSSRPSGSIGSLQDIMNLGTSAMGQLGESDDKLKDELREKMNLLQTAMYGGLRSSDMLGLMRKNFGNAFPEAAQDLNRMVGQMASQGLSSGASSAREAMSAVVQPAVKRETAKRLSKIGTGEGIVGSHKCGNAHCAKAASKICTACRTVFYCSVECQRGDWLAHKFVCKAITGSKPAEPGAK